MRTLIIVFFLAGLLPAQQRRPGQGVNFYSIEKEAVLGAQLADEVRSHTHPIDNVAVTDYVAFLSHRLTASQPGQPFTYTFTVISDDIGGSTHEPTWLPGGYIFVPTSLIPYGTE